MEKKTEKKERELCSQVDEFLDYMRRMENSLSFYWDKTSALSEEYKVVPGCWNIQAQK